MSMNLKKRTTLEDASEDDEKWIPNSAAVRVDGEVVILHCWACGTAQCVNQGLCAPGELVPYGVQTAIAG